MSMKENLKERIRNFLEIQEPQGLSINVEQLFDIEGELFKNRLWLRGNANELETFYEHIDAGHAGNRHFWSSRPTKSMNPQNSYGAAVADGGKADGRLH